MNFELLLFALAHCVFNESQNYKKVSSGTFITMKSFLKFSFKLTSIIFKHPSPGNRYKFLMRIICAPFIFLLTMRLLPTLIYALSRALRN